jgi:hypothetical protein
MAIVQNDQALAFVEGWGFGKEACRVPIGPHAEHDGIEAVIGHVPSCSQGSSQKGFVALGSVHRQNRHGMQVARRKRNIRYQNATHKVEIEPGIVVGNTAFGTFSGKGRAKQLGRGSSGEREVSEGNLGQTLPEMLG